MKRRDLIKAATLSATALATSGGSRPARGGETGQARCRSNAARLARREYGKTGVRLSIIGFPGLALSGLEPDRANRLVAQAVERGVNYFDVAPTYGNAEERLGPALEPYRKNVFLACKTTRRDAEPAAVELNRSLERLRSDYLDLYQLHAITNVGKDVDAAFAKGGAMEVLTAAKKEGRVRFLGFSAHSVEAALAAMDRYQFDSVLFPVNFACWYKNGFGPQIMNRAREKGVARLALKALARQEWPKDAPRRERYRKCWYQPITDLDEADLGLRFCLGQPVTAAVPPAAEFLFRPALDLAMDYAPLSPAQEQELKTLADKMNPIFPRAKTNSS